MKKIEFYRTTSFGGTDGREYEERDFETKEAAMQNAIEDTWNTYFTLYEIEMIMDGRISYKQKYIGRIPCYQDVKDEKNHQPKKA